MCQTGAWRAAVDFTIPPLADLWPTPIVRPRPRTHLEGVCGHMFLILILAPPNDTIGGGSVVITPTPGVRKFGAAAHALAGGVVSP